MSLFYEALPHAGGSLLPSVFNRRIDAPALPDSFVGFNPFEI